MGAQKDLKAQHTPGPWEYVPSTEHHGPYVVGPHGGDIADCYTMSNPTLPSVRNGGTSQPIPFFGEMADPNARLIAAAPDGYEANRFALMALCAVRKHEGLHPNLVKDIDFAIECCRAAIAKAEGR